MATIKIGNRNVSFSKGVYTANIGGKVVSEPSLERLKSKINLFKANRGVRAGKKVFARLRK